MTRINPENIFAGVEISDSGIYEIQSSRRIVSIPREKIQGIILQKAIPAERPIALIILSLILISIGLYGFKAIFKWLNEGGILYIDITSASLLLIPLGVWLLLSGIKKKILLLVKMENDQRKVVFNQKLDLIKIRDFVFKSQNKFGYQISDSTL